MNIEDVLTLCRYYRGEKKNPFRDDVAASLWDYERVWANEFLRSMNSPGYEPHAEMLSEYEAVGLSDFHSDDGVPVSLKALLFNRFAKTAYSLSSAVEPFKKFYDKYYN